MSIFVALNGSFGISFTRVTRGRGSVEMQGMSSSTAHEQSSHGPIGRPAAVEGTSNQPCHPDFVPFAASHMTKKLSDGVYRSKRPGGDRIASEKNMLALAIP
jgi:hypothetical protein